MYCDHCVWLELHPLNFKKQSLGRATISNGKIADSDTVLLVVATRTPSLISACRPISGNVPRPICEE